MTKSQHSASEVPPVETDRTAGAYSAKAIAELGRSKITAA